MRMMICLAAALLFQSGQLSAQAPGESFESHTIWKQTVRGVSASLDEGAADSTGDLWFISDPPAAESPAPQLVHISANGTVVSRDRLPESIKPPLPEVSSFAVATSATAGLLAIVAQHSHTIGRGEHFDGADFIPVDRSEWGVPVRIAGSGPEYQSLIALSDGHFLAMGDQSPMVLIKLDATGKIEWKRRFPSTDRRAHV